MHHGIVSNSIEISSTLNALLSPYGFRECTDFEDIKNFNPSVTIETLEV